MVNVLYTSMQLHGCLLTPVVSVCEADTSVGYLGGFFMPVVDTIIDKTNKTKIFSKF